MRPELKREIDHDSRANVAGLFSRLAEIIRPEPDDEADRRLELFDQAQAATDPKERERLMHEWHEAHKVLAER